MHDNDNYTNYVLRSNISPPQNAGLTSFENDIHDMVRNIGFRNVRSDFQDKLKEDINEMCSFKKTYLFLPTSQQTCTKYQTQITTEFYVTTSPVIIENVKMVLGIKSIKKLKK